MTAVNRMPAWTEIAGIVLIVSDVGAHSGMEMNARRRHVGATAVLSAAATVAVVLPRRHARPAPDPTRRHPPEEDRRAR
jgi:hypothetical protein